MIVKFHSRGTGGGAGPVNYLLGRDRDREGARVLRGDPEQIRELIDTVQFRQRYKSCVLSFSEDDIPDAQKAAIMDTFEATLFPGMTGDQYAVLWVEHVDKGRLELNAVIPCVELQTGKRLQPYYDRIDRQRVNDWKTLVNHRFNLSDPDDPLHRRALSTPGNLPRDVARAQQDLTAGLLALIESGVISDRAGVVSALTEGGFSVARQTKKSISIKNPAGGQNIRLTGAIYAENFRAGPAVQREIEAASVEYRAGAEKRVSAIRDRYQGAIAGRAEKNRERYRRPQPAAPERPQGLALGRGVGVGVPGGGIRAGVVVDGRTVHPDPAVGGVRGNRVYGQHEKGVQNEVTHDRIGTAALERVRAAAGVVRAVAAGLRAGAQRCAAAVDRIGRIWRAEDAQTASPRWQSLPELQKRAENAPSGPEI